MPEKPMQELVVAFAGPLVNVVIMILLLPFIYDFNFPENETEKALVIGSSNFLPMLGMVNIWLALFNLIPAFPMDGGRVLRALLAMKTNRLKATQVAASIGKIVAIGFVILGFYMNPFLIFIGLFIILGAHAEAEMVKNQFYISDLKASDALMTNFPKIDRNKTIGDAVKILLDGEAKSFLVTESGNPYGILSRDHIIKGISQFGESAIIETITDKNLIYSEMDSSLNDIFQLFQQTRSPIILIRKNTVFEGIIDAENIAELIMIKTARVHPEK
ncbi:MAG: site-2 protease family protein [Bacteroidetes bacterium]|nr:site-2 protease family protein [Bacteroidota bacterium]